MSADLRLITITPETAQQLAVPVNGCHHPRAALRLAGDAKLFCLGCGTWFSGDATGAATNVGLRPPVAGEGEILSLIDRIDTARAALRRVVEDLDAAGGYDLLRPQIWGLIQSLEQESSRLCFARSISATVTWNQKGGENELQERSWEEEPGG